MHVSRVALITALMLAAPSLAYSQAGYVIPGATAPRDPLPRFTIAPRGGALAPIGLPLPSIGLPAPGAPDAPGAPNAPIALYAPVWLFYVPQPIAAPPAPAPQPRHVEAPLPGRLVLDVEPATAQIFTDGYYAGLPEDFSSTRGGLVIDAGVHRLDLSANGYEAIAVDLRVNPGQVVTYRATLKALPPPSAMAPTTFYLIPGCYMGNIPPKDAHLPATCDPTRAITWQP